MFINDPTHLTVEEDKLYNKALDLFAEVLDEYLGSPVEFSVSRGNVSIFREILPNGVIHDGVIFGDGTTVECYNGENIDRITING